MRSWPGLQILSVNYADLHGSFSIALASFTNLLKKQSADRRRLGHDWGMAGIASWDSHLGPYNLKCRFYGEKDIYTFTYLRKEHFHIVRLADIMVLFHLACFC